MLVVSIVSQLENRPLHMGSSKTGGRAGRSAVPLGEGLWQHQQCAIDSVVLEDPWCTTDVGKTRLCDYQSPCVTGRDSMDSPAPSLSTLTRHLTDMRDDSR